MKKIENSTKGLEIKAEELRIKLKEKETMLRISKFKLSEVSRSIKHGQLKPIVQEENRVSPTNFLRAKSKNTVDQPYLERVRTRKVRPIQLQNEATFNPKTPLIQN